MVKCSGEFKQNKDWKISIRSSNEITGNLSDNSMHGEVGT